MNVMKTEMNKTLKTVDGYWFQISGTKIKETKRSYVFRLFATFFRSHFHRFFNHYFLITSTLFNLK